MTGEKQKLVEQNIQLAHYVANRFRNTSVEFDELKSLAYLGLAKAANKFDPDKGYEFSTFAVRVMSNEILHYLRSHRKHSVVVTSLDAEIVPEEDYTLKDIVPGNFDGFDSIEQMNDLQQHIDKLNKTEKKVLQFKLENLGATQEELGTLLNMTQSYVSRVMARIRQKMLTV